MCHVAVGEHSLLLIEMELVSSVSFSELLLVSTFGMMLGGILTSFFQWTENPIVQTILNATSVVLKNTEVVWKPVADFALTVLKPLGPLAILAIKTLIGALLFVGQTVSHAFQTVVNFGESLGLNMTQTGKALLYGARDFASSLYTVVKALAYLVANTLSSVSYVIDSFEMVGLYIRRLLFEPHLVTWQETLDIAVPFAVVACLMTFVFWRAYNKFVKPSAPWKKDDDEYSIPRRSSRIARKRAMMMCYDVSDTTLARKKTSARAANL